MKILSRAYYPMTYYMISTMEILYVQSLPDVILCPNNESLCRWCNNPRGGTFGSAWICCKADISELQYILLVLGRRGLCHECCVRNIATELAIDDSVLGGGGK